MIERVNICGIPHTVEYCEDKFDTDTHFGHIDHRTSTIRLNKDMPQEIINETLCHEILHGIFFHLGEDELSQNERLITALGAAINQTFSVKGI